MSPVQYAERFSDIELEKIIDEGMIYMCACPAQLAEALRKVRQLYRYQVSCLTEPRNDPIVHNAIAESSALAHQQLEVALQRDGVEAARVAALAGDLARAADAFAGAEGPDPGLRVGQQGQAGQQRGDNGEVSKRRHDGSRLQR